MVNKSKQKQRIETLVNARTLAAELAPGGGIGRQTILRWAREKRIPSVRLGYRTLKFDANAVREALTAFQTEAVR